MKMKSFVPAVLAATLSLAALPSLAEIPRRLLGDLAPPEAAERTITITPGTRYVNVEGGEIVRFEAGGTSFAWNFDAGENVMAFDLNQVAPLGMLGRPVIVYISPNPLYTGG